MTTRQRISAPKKRTGYFACKDAHVHCTEERPSCKRCLSIILKCTYGIKLTWREDALSRNIAHGRSGVWSRNPCRGSTPAPCFPPGYHPIKVRASEKKDEPVQYVFENLTVQDFASRTSIDSDGLILHSDDQDTASINACNRLTDEIYEEIEEVEEIIRRPDTLQYPMSLHMFDRVESHLLNYFVHELGPKCSLSSTNNPYIHVLIPIAMEFQPLRDALLAASANSLRLQDDTRYESHALKYKSSALRGLRRTLDANIIDWRGLATTLMFCFYDISDGCEPSWIMHLNLGLRMLKQLGTTTKVDTDLMSFCEIYFVAHEVMGRTAWMAGGSAYEDYAWAVDRLDEIDPLMGCSRELITIIGKISQLATFFSATSDEVSYQQLLTLRHELSKRLLRLHQRPASDAQNIHQLVLIAEGKRLAALLHLEERIPRSPNSMSSASILISAILEVVHALPTSNAAMLWPLFIIGTSASSTQEHRAIVLERLGKLQKSRKLGSIYHARRMVERRLSSQTMQHTHSQYQLAHEPETDNERWVSLA